MDFQKVALTVLADFTPGPKVLDFPAPEVDWLDVRCANNVARSTVDTMRPDLVEALANCRRLRDGQQLAHVVNQPTGC